MAKEKITAPEVNASLVIGGPELRISKQEAFEVMKDAPASAWEELTGEYWKWSEHSKGTYIFIFKGITSFSKNDELIQAVRLETEEGTEVINGATVLVNSLKKVTQLPCFVRVDYQGTEKTIKGEYDKLSVKVIPDALR